MSFLRFLTILSLVVWVGGIAFFAFVLAPTAFAVLPTTHLAGSVVAVTLSKLHWIGIVCGIAFLICSMGLQRVVRGRARPLAMPHLLLYAMLALTCISQFAVMPKMARLRVSVGEIESVPVANPARAQFEALHVWSVRLEGAVLLFGVLAVYSTARRTS
jgi:uncharacterized membrane protein